MEAPTWSALRPAGFVFSNPTFGLADGHGMRQNTLADLRAPVLGFVFSNDDISAPDCVPSARWTML
jgi:hypothetical protein